MSKVNFKKIDFTTGSIPKNIILNTIPLWISSAFYVGFNPWELYLVGKLGSEAIAALTIGGTGVMLFWVVMIGLSNASIAMVGNLAGKGDIRGASKLAKEIMGLTFLISLILAIIGYLVSPWLMSILGAEVEVLRLAIPYMRICMLGATIAFPVYVINGILRGTGEMKLSMIIVCGAITINAILLPPFIFGFGLGLNGAALAYVVADGTGTLAGIWVLSRGKSTIKIDLRIEKFLRLITIKEVLRFVSLNSFELFAISVVELVMMSLVGIFGTYALAAYGIGRRMLMMVSLLGFDLAITTSVIVANNLGAKKVKRAELSAWIASAFNILIMGSAAIILFVLAERTIAIFDPNPEVIEVGAGYLRITTPGWVFLAMWIILRRALIGARDVISPLLISLFTLGVQIFLAYSLKSLGINGVWWAIFTANVLQGLISSAWFYTGRWKIRST